MSEIRLLVVDGEESVRKTVKEAASNEGFCVEEAPNGIAALKLFRRNPYNLVIMDTLLPELDGRNVCRQIRKASDIPVIFISSENEEEDILEGYKAGADEYMAKPFLPSVLMACVKVFLYRCNGLQNDTSRIITANEIQIDTVSRMVYVDGRAVKLTPKEYELLLFLMRNPNKAFSRDVLLNKVWGNDLFITDRTIDTHIKSLRESMKPYQKYISTVWGFGYKFIL